MADRVDYDKTAPFGTVGSWSTLMAAAVRHPLFVINAIKIYLFISQKIDDNSSLIVYCVFC